MRSLWRIATWVAVVLVVVACAPSLSTPADTPHATTSSSAPNPHLTPSPTVGGLARSPIAAGGDHTCVLTLGGGVKCWGSNGRGQLGNGTTTDSNVPVDVSGLASEVAAVAAGLAHTCALSGGGGVKCWGANDYGALGDGSTVASLVPVDVANLASGVSAIAAGGLHTCALMSDGGVKCWGYNGFGGLGNGSTAESLVPIEVAGLVSKVTAIAAGFEHTCALTSDRGVKCWGSRTGGALGSGATSNSLVPVDVAGLASEVSGIAAGQGNTCAVTSGGTVKCWGDFWSNVPIEVAGLSSAVVAITTGANACALTIGGGVTCWGHDGLAVDVPGLVGGVTSIATGTEHTCALTGDGVKCWGANWHGQLGNDRPCGSWSSSSIPVDVVFATPSGIEPTGTPAGEIGHATGATDVVFRFNRGPDVAVGELEGELFQPGPEFTLYGDGTVIFRNELVQPTDAEGAIVRAAPFTVAHLNGDQVQSLLRFLIGEGGLGDACERYETRDVDGVGSNVLTIRAGGLDKRVEDLGSAPFGPVYDYIRTFGGRGDLQTQGWVADRYHGSLFEAGAAIEIGVLPDPNDAGIVAWPWPDITPGDFVVPPDPGWEAPRRVMSADDAAVLGLSANGGVIQRVYVLGPDEATVYSFSLWPFLPDELS